MSKSVQSSKIYVRNGQFIRCVRLQTTALIDGLRLIEIELPAFTFLGEDAPSQEDLKAITRTEPEWL